MIPSLSDNKESIRPLRTAAGPLSTSLEEALLLDGKRPKRTNHVETPEFKRWFGDSVVLDKLGKPLVVYRGIKDVVVRIKDGRCALIPKNGVLQGFEIEPGIYFSPDPRIAAKYGNPVPFYLRAKNIIRNEAPLATWPEDADAIFRTRGPLTQTYEAWEIAIASPFQAKLAVGNSGFFDPENPDCRF